MKLTILKERRPGERRVAATPETVRKLSQLGFAVTIEAGAGEAAAYPDRLYAEAGATLAPDAATALAGAAVLLKVNGPSLAAEGGDEITPVPGGCTIVGLLAPFQRPHAIAALAERGCTVFALEFVPRITRAQSMDVLSSQSNLAGYRAVLEAAAHFTRAFPQLMTAAGTIQPARVMVMGAGVAGLQAIATARRLGARVSATDVRLAAKEQVESLGATFVMVDDEEARQAETSGGYAKEMSDSYKEKQAKLIAETLAKQDIAITTALIPGRPAPRLITAAMVATMRPGSVIVDLAAEAGGNCELTVPGEVARREGVTIVGTLNLPSALATDASALYARNLLNFLTPLVAKETKTLAPDWNDEIVKAACVARDGQVVHSAVQAALTSVPAPAPRPSAPEVLLAEEPPIAHTPLAEPPRAQPAPSDPAPASLPEALAVEAAAPPAAVRARRPRAEPAPPAVDADAALKKPRTRKKTEPGSAEPSAAPDPAPDAAPPAVPGSASE